MFRSAQGRETASVCLQQQLWFFILNEIKCFPSGQKFAMYEDKVIVSTLLRQFRFGIDVHRLPIKESLNMILKPEGGMPLLIAPRR